ncbi:MAG TPA: metalloregulator ArsR/SmtB family transcription factor [Chryseolinea sp.]|nr:metalloregulator ArsR/SmtB family transcription factor [Chryseolinea sp.]
MRRDVFQAISDPTRRAIISLIADNSITLNGVTEKFNISRQAIAKHVKILTECGLIVIHSQGRERLCEARLERLNEVSDWLEPLRQSCEHRFNKLDSLLIDFKRNKKTTKRK